MPPPRRSNGSIPTGAAPRRDLDPLERVAKDPSVERAVLSVRELLGMDVAYVTEFVDGEQIFQTLRGDGESFGVAEGTSMPLDQTYCQRVLAGEMPNVTPDVAEDPVGSALPITAAAEVGAFVSVPLRLSDGSLYGTLCAADHEARDDLGDRELQFLHIFARLIVDQLEHKQAAARERVLALEAASVEALIAAVSARDAYTGEHSVSVVGQATAVARQMDLAAECIADVAKVALLHDIGKLRVPDAILHKPGPLSEGEWKVMHLHPVFGEELIQQVPGLEHLGPAIRAEHERWDGNGYPDGLAGEQIPIESRIAFACDAYHAMTSDRPYRQSLSPARARTEIQAGAGTQFCPRAAAALLAVVGS